MVDLLAIKKAREIITGHVFHTPLAPSPHLSNLIGAQVWLKLENLQRTGSFKIRGAYHKLHNIARSCPGSAVVAASAGNHAQGVAASARLLGLQAVIYMPEGAPLSKRQATAGSGAEVRLHGQRVGEALEAAQDTAKSRGMTLVHPYDDEDIIAGQGSLGLEIMEDLSGVEAVAAPLGGGGLIAGVAAAIKETLPHVQIIGVEPERAASASAALKDGAPVEIDTRPTLADGARLAKVGQLTYPLIDRYVDQVVAVDEDSIARAMLLLLERRRVVAEGAGALPLAAFLTGAVPQLQGKKVVLLISGGNVDSNLLGRIIGSGLVRSGRIFRFSAVLDDSPGALASLLVGIAEQRANVLGIHHDRMAQDLPPDQSRVHLEIETRGFEHIEEIAAKLARLGYGVSLG